MLLKILDNNSPVSFIVNAILLLVTAIAVVLAGHQSVTVWYVINVFFLAATFLLLNIMSDKFHLFKELTYLPSFFLWLLSVTIFPHFFHVFLGGYLFLFTWYLFLVLSIYHQPDVKNIAFNAGFLVGLFYIVDAHLLLLSVLLFAMLLLSRTFYWREWLLGLLGVALPLFYVETFRSLHFSVPSVATLESNNGQVDNLWLFILLGGLLLLLTLLYLGRKTVRKRNIYTILIFTLVLTTILFYAFDNLTAIVLSFPVLSILIVHLYHQINKPLVRWLIVCLVALFVVGYYFLYYKII
jgi:hypothetical protein